MDPSSETPPETTPEKAPENAPEIKAEVQAQTQPVASQAQSQSGGHELFAAIASLPEKIVDALRESATVKTPETKTPENPPANTGGNAAPQGEAKVPGKTGFANWWFK